MMNYIWGFLILCGFGAFALSGDPAASVDAMLSGVSEALELCLGLCPCFMLWLGLMNVAKEAGLMEKLSRAARPLLKRLMPTRPRLPTACSQKTTRTRTWKSSKTR